MSIWDSLEERLESWKACDHDSRCEQQERSFICHCAKRRRLANGPTELPTEDLYFPPPDCPTCDSELSHDGDSWRCDACHLSWSSNGVGSSAEFTDDYGTDFGGEQFGRRLVDIARGDL